MTHPDRSLRGLAVALRVFAAFAMVTAAMDVIAGLDVLKQTSPELAVVSGNILLESQLRYLGAMWGGFGALLWWIAADMRARGVPLMIVSVAVFVGGIGRCIAAARYGIGPTMLAAFIAIELLGPPIVLTLWYRQMRHDGDHAVER